MKIHHICTSIILLLSPMAQAMTTQDAGIGSQALKQVTVKVVPVPGDFWLWIRTRIELQNGYATYICAASKWSELSALAYTSIDAFTLMNAKTQSGYRVTWVTIPGVDNPKPLNSPAWCWE